MTQLTVIIRIWRTATNSGMQLGQSLGCSCRCCCSNCPAAAVAVTPSVLLL